MYNALDTIEVNGQKITGRRSVTVGKVIQVVLILVIGYLLCRLLASLVERIATRRFRIPAQTAHILSKWMLGIFLSLLIVFSLILVKIPFEAFAFLGGALAIGVGFGITSGEEAAAVASFADAVVVGTSIMRRVEAQGNGAGLAADVGAFIGELRRATRRAGAQRDGRRRCGRQLAVRRLGQLDRAPAAER